MTTHMAMGGRVALLVAIFVSIGASAQAQQFPPRSPAPYLEPAPPPVSPVDMPNYCVYENRVYSLGSGICVGRTPYVCVPSPGPSTGNRAYWAGKEDQVFLRPACN
jgi:Protein of unknown function (DUF1496)